MHNHYRVLIAGYICEAVAQCDNLTKIYMMQYTKNLTATFLYNIYAVDHNHGNDDRR